MFQQHFVHLAGVHVVAAHDNHVLFAVYYIEVAVIVHGCQVARVQPAIAQCAGAFVGPAPVAVHDLRALHDQFAHLAGGQGKRAAFHVHNAGVCARHRHADGVGALPLRAQRVAVRDGRGLGKAVAFKNGRAGCFLKFTENLAWQRRRARNAYLDAAQVKIGQILLLQ